MIEKIMAAKFVELEQELKMPSAVVQIVPNWADSATLSSGKSRRKRRGGVIRRASGLRDISFNSLIWRAFMELASEKSLVMK